MDLLGKTFIGSRVIDEIGKMNAVLRAVGVCVVGFGTRCTRCRNAGQC
jgi:hypothetical protein